MKNVRLVLAFAASMTAIASGVATASPKTDPATQPSHPAGASRVPGIVMAQGMMGMPPQSGSPMPAPRAGAGMMMDDKMATPPSPGMPNAGAAAAMPMPPAAAPAPAQGMPRMGMGMGMSQAPAAGGAMPDKMAMPPTSAMPAVGAATPSGVMPMPPSAPATASSMPSMGMGMMPSMMQAMMRAQAVDPLDHIEGRIAFIRAELGITDAQAPAWERFAQDLRNNRQHAMEARQALATANGQADALSRLTAYEKHASMRLDALHAARSSFEGLYGMLSEKQKQAAVELVLPLVEAS